MKQVVRKGFAEIVVAEVPDPVTRPHHVLIRPEFSLISSGTETASIHRDGVLKEVAENPSHLRKIWDVMQATGPLETLAEVKARFSSYAVLGYAGAGVVVQAHPTVHDLKVGERVAYGGEGTGHAQTILAGRNLVARVPDSLSLDQACFATLGSIAMNAVRVSGIGIGDVVVVLGLGLVGQLVAQLAKLQGAFVIGIDLKRERIDLATELGADRTATEMIKETVLAATDGRGADAVIVAAAAKSPQPAQQALDICRDRGRLVILGAVELNLPWHEMYMKEIQLFMSRAYGPGSYDPLYESKGQDYPISYVRWTENRNMEEFLRLCAQQRVRVLPLITHRFPLDEAPRAYETIMNPSSGSLAVVLTYPTPSRLPEGKERRSSDIEPFVGQRRVSISETPREGIGVALVGASNIAKWAHVPSIRKIQGAYLRAVVSNSGVRGRGYAERFGADYCCAQLDEVLADPKVSAVIITSRNQHHAAEAVAALDAGKHVFVEKPMALTEDECRQVERAAQQSGKVLWVGFNRRYAPFYVEAKAALKGRAAPAVVHCRVNSPGISGSFWMADPAIGGAILGEACHFVDLMYWLLDSEPVAVSAWSLPALMKEPIGENNLTSTFRFADGSIASLTYCTVGSKTSAGERLEVFAPGIGVTTENFKNLSVQGRFERRKSSWFAQKGYDGQMRAFVSAISGNVAAVTARDGTRATIGCLRMLESARTQQPQPIDLDSVMSPITVG